MRPDGRDGPDGIGEAAQDRYARSVTGNGPAALPNKPEHEPEHDGHRHGDRNRDT